ncbi:MAG: hypothetical protein EOP45_15335 [Sphingobacteriaceae bacterium]|nr:MAG: hypothetical protein EOP45_15335 [Sphingobacteriaceae bacterium]
MATQFDWRVDMHPDVYLSGLEVSDATAASSTKERMARVLFDSPVMLHVPISYYSEYKRRLIVQGTVRDVMISIHYFYTGIPLTIWDLRSVDALKDCQTLAGACYASVVERFNEGGLVFWSDMIDDDKCWGGPIMDSIRSEGIVIGTIKTMGNGR